MNPLTLGKRLVNFGLIGDFIGKKSTHDKLDAATSALFGYYFLAEEYEAIGDKEEGYLVIPKSNRHSNTACSGP